MPGGVNSPVRAFGPVGGEPFYTRSAQGAFLTTEDDRELLDYVGTWGPAILGHNSPVVREAVAEALAEGTSYGTCHRREVLMAERVIAAVPSIENVRMVNSGTEATLSCIRLARGVTGRPLIIKFAGCYHGHVDSLLVKAGSGALTHGHPDSAGITDAVAAQTIVLPYNDLDAVEATFAERGDEIAAIILEPYPANCGFLLPKPGYLEGLRRITTERGSLLIFDEVMTGFRLALGGVQERVGITPDLTALGKIIGGGLPVGAFGGRREIMEHLAPLGPVYQAGTLSGNPLALAAGLAVLERLQTEPPYAYLEALGASLRDGVAAAAAEQGLPLRVHQVGSMVSFFFSETEVVDLDDVLASATDRFAPVFRHLLDSGIFLPPSGFETAFISCAHRPEDVDRTCSAFGKALKVAA